MRNLIEGCGVLEEVGSEAAFELPKLDASMLLMSKRSCSWYFGICGSLRTGYWEKFSRSNESGLHAREVQSSTTSSRSWFLHTAALGSGVLVSKEVVDDEPESVAP